MQNSGNNIRSANRRSFLRNGALGAGAVAGIGFFSQHAVAFDNQRNSPLNRGPCDSEWAIATGLGCGISAPGCRNEVNNL
jgi:hypothetical protein